MKSVKEVAEICNVSKQAVFNQIKAYNIETVKVKNVAYVLHDEKVEILVNHFNKDHQAEDKALDEVKSESTMLSKAINQNKENDKAVVNLMNTNKARNSKEEVNQLKSEIKLLSSQLESERQLTSILTSQTEKDNRQISDLTRLLENQQILALESARKVKELETELNEVRLMLDQSHISKAGDIEEVKTVIDDKEVITNSVKEDNKISAFWIAYTLLTSPFRKGR